MPPHTACWTTTCTRHTAAMLLHPDRDPLTLVAPQPGVTPQPLTDFQQSLDWFTTERPVLLAAVDHAATTGFDSHAWQLAWTLTTFLDRRGDWHDQAVTGRAAVTAAHRLANLPAQAFAHRSIAHAYTRLGRFDDAHIYLQRALDLYRRAGDQVGQARAHLNIAMLRERQADHDLGNRGGQAATWDSLGYWVTPTTTSVTTPRLSLAISTLSPCIRT
jgi:tetratricopeptide (TPR) repeat protein